MKKRLTIFTLLSSTLLFGACSNSKPRSEEKSHSNIKTSQKTSSISQSISSQSNSQNSLWDQSKKKQLDAFIRQWGNNTKQHYQSYNPHHNLNYYGCVFPSNLKHTLLKVNDQIVTMNWSNNGKGKADYNIIGIYSNTETSKPMKAYLYFFAFHKNQPIILVTQQNNGNVSKTDSSNPKNGLHFNVAKNAELTKGFNAIINNQVPQLNGKPLNFNISHK